MGCVLIATDILPGDGIEPPTCGMICRAPDQSRTPLSHLSGFHIMLYFHTSNFWKVHYVSVVGSVVACR